MATHARRSVVPSWAGPWVPRFFLLIAALLIPWDVFLALTLPRRSVAQHYDAAWVGFDIILILVMARIGWLVHRRNPHVVLTATAGATLLMVDAWFDVLTSTPGGALTQAVLEAVFLELPGAVLCTLLARRGMAALIARIEAPPRRRQR